MTRPTSNCGGYIFRYEKQFKVDFTSYVEEHDSKPLSTSSQLHFRGDFPVGGSS